MTERTELIIGHARGIIYLIKLYRVAETTKDKTIANAALDGIRQRIKELRRLMA